MKMKRTICVVLGTALAVTAFAGCGKQKTDDASKSEKLKWVMIGPGKQKDADMVWAEFNKQLAEKLPNTEVEFEIIEGSAYGEKWQLMSAASEQIDIAWSGYAVPSFLGEVEKGAYLPLNDLIDENAPDIKEELPDWLFKLTTVDDKIYAIPNYQVMSTTPLGLHIRKEHEQYIDIDKIQKAYMEFRNDFSKGQAFYDTIAEYLENMKQAGKIGKGVGLGLGSFDAIADKVYDSTTVSNFWIDPDTLKVFYDGTSPYKKLWYDVAEDWYKKGYIRNDILSENMDGADEAEKGYILWAHGYFNKTIEKIESMQKGFDTRVFGLSDKSYIKNSVPATMTALGRTCKNPQRAIKVLELMHTEKGKDLYNLLTFGLEGTHYEKVSENRIKPVDYTSQGDSNSKYGLWKWAVGNTLNAYELPGDEDGMADYIKELDNSSELLPTVGFKPDMSEYTVELAQIKSVEDEYKTLKYGALPNQQETYKEYEAKLESAGVEKVREGIQKQLDKWLSENKK